MNKRTASKLVFASALIFVAAILVLVAAAWGNRTSSQRQAIAALNDIGESTMQRTGMADCMPSFVFDKRGPQQVEDFTGPAYFGNVTAVWFRQFDERQLTESISHLHQIPQLDRIGFHSPIDRAVVARMREALPKVTFVDDKGKPFAK